MISFARDYRRILGLLKRERRPYLWGLGALLLVNLGDVLAPLFLAVAIDLVGAALSQRPLQLPPLMAWMDWSVSTQSLTAAVLAYLALQLTSNVFRYPMLMKVAVPSHRIGQDLRRTFTAHLVKLPRSFFDRHKSGDLMSLATADIGAVRMMLGPGILVGGDTIFLMVLVLSVLSSLSGYLTLVTLIPLPFVFGITNWLSHAEYKRFEAVQADLSELTERVRESFAGIRILQGYAREDYDRSRFQEFSWRHLTKNLRLARVISIFEPSLDLMVGISTILVLLFGGLQVAHGEMTLGTFVAFLFLVGYLSGPMIGFGWAVSLFQRGRASLHRIDRFLSSPISIEDTPEAEPARGPAHLEVRDLSFTYGSALNPVLSGISFELAPGRTLGIVGPVGAGKTTLVNLLVRLYEPPEGTIFVDGQDIRQVTLATLRAQIVVTPQETFLFGDTVHRNVLLSTTEEQVEPAPYAELARVHDEVAALPEGYQTLLGERGVNLSGGQRQRLAIARGIAADPRVLVLDDCLSAVDADTEQAIIANLRRVFAGRSGIVVSHRVVAVQGCDEIVVLRDGEIVERGTHDALIAQDGYYAETARQQTFIENDKPARF